MLVLRELLVTASGIGERGWDGFNYYRNVVTPTATASWDEKVAMNGRVFIKVYPIAPECQELHAVLNGDVSAALRLMPGTFPELLMAGEFKKGTNTLTISTTCPADTLRIYKLQAHPLAPASAPAQELGGAGLIVITLMVLLAVYLAVVR